ncbi:Hypothetical predicted protein [Paramuricea clavata]|uniref:Uncharacterized protein n=1 Tax=Paramuricea clavata TaxID=317549 RepID=A0A7D9JFW7_PARCT|nr:Hypothetical predicted protein [Paramuricea clavata]
MKRKLSRTCRLKSPVKAAILKIEDQFKELRKLVLKESAKVQNAVKNIANLLKKTINGKNCADLYKKGIKKSGVYQINPDNKGIFNVFCDMTTSGGGWAVFQRRHDGSVDFYRGWQDYKHGFGDLKGEFWLGLDKINRLTTAAQN